jgi:hypothetical protein
MNENFFGYEVSRPSKGLRMQQQAHPVGSALSSSSRRIPTDVFKSPPEASPALKSLIREFKDNFKEDAAWDGEFVL